MRRVLFAALCLATVAAGCSLHDPTPTNVRPPKPGVPAGIPDVTGIYRTIHQGLLQLRSNGEFVLIVPTSAGATSGSFTLQDGKLSVTTPSCGTTTGQYNVLVSGEQAPGKAVLNFSVIDDACQDRNHYLTVDPWVYADS